MVSATVYLLFLSLPPFLLIFLYYNYYRRDYYYYYCCHLTVAWCSFSLTPSPTSYPLFFGVCEYIFF